MVRTTQTSILMLTYMKDFDTVKALLEEHSRQIMDTGFFKKIDIHMSTDSNIIGMVLFPKTPEDWIKYNDGPRAGIKMWFADNLLEVHLVSFLKAWPSEITME